MNKLAVAAKLIQIGNSRGVRLPKELIEQAGLGDEIELVVRDGEILIANRRRPRQGWAEIYEELARTGQLALTEEDQEWLNMRSLPEEEADWEWE
ncbi:MAG TPA: AbrB/MazE/SpoVT family DNA-binding domain-containing protein [Candidatus Saccharimonadia bacterium]|nr:AbrB/MazE/SpoVT family DNA-binding domain-containing protein [Candidatus Saccharimonadia bacterium]